MGSERCAVEGSEEGFQASDAGEDYGGAEYDLGYHVCLFVVAEGYVWPEVVEAEGYWYTEAGGWACQSCTVTCCGVRDDSGRCPMRDLHESTVQYRADS